MKLSTNFIVTSTGVLRMRMRAAGVNSWYNLGCSVDRDKWDASGQRCMRNTIHGKKQIPAARINAEISRYEQIVHTIQELLPPEATPEQARHSLLQALGKVKDETTRPADPYQAFDRFISEEGSAAKWGRSTYAKFHTLRRHLHNFAPVLTFQDFTETFFDTFGNYVQVIGHRNNTIKKDISMLKWFLRWALRKGYTTDNRFLTYRPRLKTTPKRVIFLTWDELMHVYNYSFPENKQYLRRVRDTFCFSCFTSLRYSDLLNLKKENINGGIITITTKKTHDPLRIELNKYSSAILAQYATLPGNLALPVISNQKMNAYLKELGELCGLNTPVTETYYIGGQRIETTAPKYQLLSTHSGRRTFICNALMLGIAPNIVMKWTGHSDYKSMKPYIDIADSVKASAMQLFNK